MKRIERTPSWKMLLLAGVLGSCAASVQAEAIGSAGSVSAAETSTQQSSPMAELALARDYVQAAKVDIRMAEARGLPQPEGRAWIKKAIKIGLAGDTDQARELAQKASAKARAALNVYFTEQAQKRLGVLQRDYVDQMNTTQRTRLVSAESALGADKPEVAWMQLSSLSDELGYGDQGGEKLMQVTVQKGDTLSAIARRPEVYGNIDMWPLLLQANRSKFLRVDLIPIGTVLDINRRATDEEIEKAIRQARLYFSGQ